MPRSTKAARIRITSDATVASMPDDTTASRYTWAITVPTRGIVKEINFLITNGSSINGSGGTEYTSFYMHTTCANGAGKDTTTAGEETSIIAQYNWSLEKSLQLGGNRLFATGRYAMCVPLNKVQLSGGSRLKQRSVLRFKRHDERACRGDKHSLYYDVWSRESGVRLHLFEDSLSVYSY